MLEIPDSFVAFDLETTGLSPAACRIIEIGAVKVVNGHITETFERLINPGCRIPAQITALTGISDDMVVDALPVEWVLPMFLDFAEDMVLAAHNIRFDMSFLQHDATRMGIQIKNPQVDTVQVARRCFPKLVNHKLGTVARHLSFTPPSAHRGLDDASVVVQILLQAAQLRWGGSCPSQAGPSSVF